MLPVETNGQVQCAGLEVMCNLTMSPEATVWYDFTRGHVRVGHDWVSNIYVEQYVECI